MSTSKKHNTSQNTHTTYPKNTFQKHIPQKHTNPHPKKNIKTYK